MLLAVLLLNFGLMLAATSVHKVIGNSGASVVSRIMGLILAAVAVTNTLAGIKSYFSL